MNSRDSKITKFAKIGENKNLVNTMTFTFNFVPPWKTVLVQCYKPTLDCFV